MNLLRQQKTLQLIPSRRWLRSRKNFVLFKDFIIFTDFFISFFLPKKKSKQKKNLKKNYNNNKNNRWKLTKFKENCISPFWTAEPNLKIEIPFSDLFLAIATCSELICTEVFVTIFIQKRQSLNQYLYTASAEKYWPYTEQMIATECALLLRESRRKTFSSCLAIGVNSFLALT